MQIIFSFYMGEFGEVENGVKVLWTFEHFKHSEHLEHFEHFEHF